jgi:gliding motility-associated-like protein
MTATYDAYGNLYAGGIIFNIGYPTTLGAYSSSFFGPAYYGNTDVVITKYNSTGNALLFSTYFGGNQTETVNSLIVDKNDNLCFYGVTGSSNFPTATNAYDNTFNGGSLVAFYNNGHRYTNGTDIYVAKFNTSGNALLACTYIGGSGNDGINHSNKYISQNWPPIPPSTTNVNLPEPIYDSLQFNYGDHSRGEIQIDQQNNIYITSSTRSSDFPTVNAFDNTLGGKQDAVLFKFNSNLSTLIYSSYIGGSSNDSGNGLVIDKNNEVFVTGGTCSNDFPYATNGYQTTYQGGKADGYIIRVNSLGNTVLNGTYFGTTLYDQSYLVQSDKQNNIYVYGQSLGNMPILKAASSATVFNVPKTHQFISRFNKTLNVLNMSTVFGHDTLHTDISPSAFAVDKCSNIYISGWGTNVLGNPPLMSNMPLMNPTQSTTDGHDFYFMGLDSNAAVLKYGSYFGGNLSREHVDGGTSRFDPHGVIYQSVCAGCGANSGIGANQDFPVTPGAWPGTPGNPNHNTDNFNCNNGVIKIDFQLILAVSTINTNALSGCVPLTVQYTNANPGSSFLWHLSNTDTTSVISNPVRTYTNPGTYTVSLVVYNPLACNVKDSSVTVITVYPLPSPAFTVTVSPCSNTVTTTNTSTVVGTNSYVWNWGDSTPASTVSSPTHTYSATGIYSISLTATNENGCSAIATKSVSVFIFTTSVNSPTMCTASSATLSALGGTSYTWTPSSTLSNPLIANPIATPSTTSIYTVTINNNSAGYLCTKTLTTMVTAFPKPVSTFTYTNDSCTNILFATNTNTSTNTTYQWNWGDGTPSNTLITIPPHTYTNNGSYTVSLTANNNVGCNAITTKTISVLNFTPSVISDSICYGAHSSLNALGGTSYTWTPSSTLSNSLIANPIASPTINTTYTVIIENNSQGYTCVKTLTTNVKVYPEIKSQFTYSIGACNNDVQFTDASTITPTSFLWYFGDGNNTPTQNPQYYYNSPGTYTVSLIVSNAFGCKDTSNQVLTLLGFTPISVTANQSKCELDTIQLQANGGVTYSWMPTQYLTNAAISNPKAFPPITTIYTVTIGTVHGSDTCKSNLTTTVAIYPFTYNTNSITISSPTITLGQTATVTLIGFNQTGNLTLSPIVNYSVIGTNSITITPTKTGEYNLYFKDQFNCKHLLKTFFVVVETDMCNEGTVYLPTGFTPNGDGTNDVLYIRSNFVTQVYLTIYDRWGEKLFETNDIKNGWDGTFKGKQLDQGVYGYYMTFKCNNGQESFKKGNITLLR